MLYCILISRKELTKTGFNIPYLVIRTKTNKFIQAKCLNK